MRKRNALTALWGAALLLGAGCASMGNPSGGPRDEDPPRLVSSSPVMGATEVSPSRVVLTFDELVQLKDAFSKVVVSPPSAQVPRVSSLGRRVTVEFRDSLLPETTYTVDFGDAIADNNEGNKLEGLIYTFSTGPVLDSLMVSGMVLGASDLEPSAGIYVGLHTNLADSAFTRTRFDRIAKTDEEGRFVIGGLAPGSYRIYALDDRDGDLAWSSPEEALAFYDAVIVPRAEQTVATDSIFDLVTGAVDTVVSRDRTQFLPNNILLRSYETGFRQQYISKYERLDSTRFSLTLNAAADSMPRVDVLLNDGTAFPIDEVAVTERSATNDTITFWLRDPGLISTDSLRMAITFLKADSAWQMQPVNDTLRMYTTRLPAKAKKVDGKKDRAQADSVPPPVPTLEIRALNSKPEVNQLITLELPEPPRSFNLDMIHLQWEEDSVWKPVADFDIGMVRPDTLNPRRLRIAYPWQYETKYRLSVDSLAARGIHGLFTDDFVLEFATRKENEYGSLKFNLKDLGADSIPRFVELLGASGTPLQSLSLEEGSVTFRYLLPGKYHVRVVEDYNGNGKWDPGNFDLGILPDVSYYYKETIELKANWDQEIDWAVFATPVDKMKPDTLRSKKPKSR